MTRYIVLALLLVFLGCGGGLRPETRDALSELTSLVGKGCSAGALTPEECEKGRLALERLGLDLTEAQASLVTAWNNSAPLISRIAEVLLRLAGV